MSNLKPISHLDINLARKTFKNLRDRFKKIRKEYRPSGSAGGEPIEPTWPFFKQLLFLSPFMKHRETREISYNQSMKADLRAQLIQSACKNWLAKQSDEMSADIEEPELQFMPLPPESAVPKNRRPTVESPTSKRFSITKHPLKKGQTSKTRKILRQQPDLMKVVEDTNEFISSMSKREEPNGDDLSGQSVGKEVKKLSPYQKSLAKLKIQQILRKFNGVVKNRQLNNDGK